MDFIRVCEFSWHLSKRWDEVYLFASVGCPICNYYYCPKSLWAKTVPKSGRVPNHDNVTPWRDRMVLEKKGLNPVVFLNYFCLAWRCPCPGFLLLTRWMAQICQYGTYIYFEDRTSEKLLNSMNQNICEVKNWIFFLFVYFFQK